MTIPNQNLVNDILPLMQKQIQSLQGAFGYIYSGLRNSVQHKDPSVRNKIQGEVDCASQGLLLVYLFAMWEEYIEHQVEKDWLTTAELERLNAFRHIRHSMAHGFEGTRARQCRAEFESIMNSGQPFPNLPWDNDKLDLTKSQVAIDCQRWMEDLCRKLIGRIANDNRP